MTVLTKRIGIGKKELKFNIVLSYYISKLRVLPALCRDFKENLLYLLGLLFLFFLTKKKVKRIIADYIAFAFCAS